MECPKWDSHVSPFAQVGQALSCLSFFVARKSLPLVSPLEKFVTQSLLEYQADAVIQLKVQEFFFSR